MVKIIYFHRVGALLLYLYLVFMIRDVFLEYDKVYMVTLLYIC